MQLQLILSLAALAFGAPLSNIGVIPILPVLPSTYTLRMTVSVNQTGGPVQKFEYRLHTDSARNRYKMQLLSATPYFYDQFMLNIGNDSFTYFTYPSARVVQCYQARSMGPPFPIPPSARYNGTVFFNGKVSWIFKAITGPSTLTVYFDTTTGYLVGANYEEPGFKNNLVVTEFERSVDLNEFRRPSTVACSGPFVQSMGNMAAKNPFAKWKKQ